MHNTNGIMKYPKSTVSIFSNIVGFLSKVSILKNKKPTRAEISDVMNTLLDGANCLVLAAETAIGKFPNQSVDVLIK